MMRRLALLLGLAACGTTTEDVDVEGAPTASREDAIIGGTVDTGDPEVFEMYIQGNNNAGAGCTATLIDRKTLLTAAHCVDPRTIGATSVQLFVHNKANDNLVGFSDLIRVTETRMHPGWSGQGDSDIAMALLASAPAVTPKPWNQASIAALTGQPLRAVGYGANLGGTMPTGAGVKRQVALTFRQIFQDIFFLGDGVGKGVCHGDSGGPSFHTFPDGVERVVGVHSFTSNEACTTGADTRVDFFQAFVKQWLLEKEAPSCLEDGRCAPDCAQPDIDCVCKADGMCTTACPNLSKDPDCPPDCGMNGVCSLQACPAPDLDCVPNGLGCTSALQCPGRRCEVDSQHTDSYCSVQCTDNSQCWSGGECDAALGRCRYTYVAETPVGEICTPFLSFCAAGTRCAGPTPDFTYCSFACRTQADCAPDSSCEAGFDGRTYCRAPPRPQVFVPAAGVLEGDAASCAAVGGLWPALALVVLLRRRRS